MLLAKFYQHSDSYVAKVPLKGNVALARITSLSNLMHLIA